MTEDERIATYTDNLIGVCSIYGGTPCTPTEELRRHLSSTIREARRQAREDAWRDGMIDAVEVCRMWYAKTGAPVYQAMAEELRRKAEESDG